MMKHSKRPVSVLLLTMIVTACATDRPEDAVVSKTDAVEDYIKVAELEELDSIRSLNQFNHKVISERYIIIYDNRNSYLATYSRRCRELRQSHVTPDIRYDKNTIRARFDSVRGCKIGALHRISDGQAEELMKLGMTPGQKQT